MIKGFRMIKITIAWLALYLGGFVGSALAKDTNYYEGKTIKVVEGRRAGGTGSLRTQITMKYLVKYLGGKTTVGYEFMPAGGGVGSVNHLALKAKKDGLTIGSVSSGLFSTVLEGSPSVRFKLDDLVFLGSGSGGNPTAMVIRPQLKLDTMEKLRAYKGLRFGQRAVGHSMYVRDRLTAFVLDLPEPRWVLGYDSAEIQLALQRGEADAQFGGIPGFLRDVPQWFKGEGYTVAVILPTSKGEGAERYPDFPQGRPRLDQFADTEMKKAQIRLYNATNVAGSMFYVPKAIPGPALHGLKTAFNRVWKDPEFAREFQKTTREIADPVTGEEIHRAVSAMPNDAKTVEVYKRIVGAGPLPPAR